VAPRDVEGSPAARVGGWPNAFCRSDVGDDRATVARRMGAPTSTSVGARSRQDVWQHLEVELIAAYDGTGRVRKLKDGSGDSRLPCSARRSGDERLDAFAGRYQRACRTIVRAQRSLYQRVTRANSITSRSRADRRRNAAYAQFFVSAGRASSLMSSATAPGGLRSTQTRVARRLPTRAQNDQLVATLRAGQEPAGGIGTSFAFLRLPERLLAVAPNCDDVT